MRVLAIHQSSELYGSDRSFLAAVESLAADATTKREILVLLPGHGPLADKLVEAGIDVEYEAHGYVRRSELRSPLRFALSILGGLRSLKRRLGKDDVIYVNTLVCLSAILLGAVTRNRLIVHVREIPRPREALLFRWLLKFTRAEIVYNSNATMEAIGVVGSVVHNGVDAPEPAPAASTLTSGTGVNEAESRLRLLVLGRINAWKGQELALSALASVERVTELRIVGSAIEAQKHLEVQLKAQASELTDRVRVEFHDFCDDPSPHLAWCDYVLVPSTLPEPFGRVAIEGMSFGKPVIGSSHGGLMEIVRHGKNGYLFTPGSSSSLSEVISVLPSVGSRPYLELSSEASADFMAHFSTASYAKALVNVFVEKRSN